MVRFSERGKTNQIIVEEVIWTLAILNGSKVNFVHNLIELRRAD
jgi:hypothetical protein